LHLLHGRAILPVVGHMTSQPQLAAEMTQEWDRCAAEGVPLALLLVSPDQPESIADSEVLAHLERALRVHCARDRDVILPRPAGNFVAILPDTVPPGAHHVGEQIVEAMQHAPHPPATVSVGVAAVVPSENDDPASLLARAQRALKAAQSQGGNRCLGAVKSAAPPKNAIDQLRALWTKKKNDPDRKRRTD
jgi:PleD family two-component response regulator